MELFDEYMRDNPLSNKYLSNLIQKFVLSDAYRTSTDPSKTIEDELNRAPLIEPEKAFRDAVDRCIRASRKMHDQIIAVAPFYLGKKNATIPTNKNRIEYIINPQQTGHCHDLEDLGEALKPIKPGTCPGGKKHIHALLKVITENIDNELNKLIVNSEVNHTNTVYAWLIRYLEKPHKISYAEHCTKIDDFIARIQRHFCELSNIFSERSQKLLTKTSEPQTEIKKRVGKGPQTAFMKTQRAVFKKFLERHPITASQSAITRAHQCWLEHKKEWDEAAKRGEGYAEHKSLSRSI